MVKKIVIIKLGGSVISDKSVPFSFKKENISNLTNQIAKYYHEKHTSCIIVHGGGSFGHPLARQYQISKGFNKDVPDQIMGLSKTHHAMQELNKIIQDAFVAQNVPVLSFPPVNSFSRNKSNDFDFYCDLNLKNTLEMNILPLFYGDIVFDQSNQFGILSGDQIIQYLCQNLSKITNNTYIIEKVIFCFNKDGILKYNQDSHLQLIEKITLDEFDSIPLITPENNIDVTGSIAGKLQEIKKIVKIGIPTILLNGQVPDRLYNELNSNQVVATRILPEVPQNNDQNPMIFQRKDDHIRLALLPEAQSSHTSWMEYVRLVHQANPEINFQNVDTELAIFKKSIKFPLFIGALTGGTPIAKNINRILAEVAEKYQIGMMLGSQRITLEHPSTIPTFKITREFAPTIPLVANIGIAQILQKENQNKILEIISQIDADALAIHLNALQEVIQPEGEPHFKGTIDAVENLVKLSPIPLIIKETGAGLSKECIQQFYEIGIRYFDTAGLGGTNFAAIELMRKFKSIDINTNSSNLDIKGFVNWGIPTAASIIECSTYLKQKSPDSIIIGSGGIRNGLDMIKCCILGAKCCCIAQPMLSKAMEGFTNLSEYIDLLQTEFKKYMFLTGSANLDILSQKTYILENPLKNWVQTRIK